MVSFSELRISDDKDQIIIECAVRDLPIYTNMYIDTITIEHYENFSESGSPGGKSYVAYRNGTNGSSQRNVRCVVDLAAVSQLFALTDFDGGLFYVFVHCGGTLSPNASQYGDGATSTTDLAIVLDWRKFYKAGLKQLVAYYMGCGLKCTVPAWLEEFVMLWNAIKLAIETCDWTLLDRLWRKFLAIADGVPMNTDCNCG